MFVWLFYIVRFFIYWVFFYLVVVVRHRGSRGKQAWYWMGSWVHYTFVSKTVSRSSQL